LRLLAEYQASTHGECSLRVGRNTIGKDAEMISLDLNTLLEACSPGGPSCLNARTELLPAGGPESAVAPAKFAPQRGTESIYAYERRFVDGTVRETVLIDSKQSQLNRAEAALVQAIADGHEVLQRLPRIEVVYNRNGVAKRLSDLELPHRAFDGHIRAGTVNGVPTTDLPFYRALRDASPANARPLLEASPATLVFGGWDSSRKSNQGRWRSALVGEVVGVCIDRELPKKGGARVDPVGMQVKMPGAKLKALADAQRGELSPKLYKKILDEAKDPKGEGVSASRLGLGGIPPSLVALGGVACERIIRSHVLSFAALRQIRFGAGPAGDAACRALLAAIALSGLARSDAELYFRANCDLVEAGPPVVTIDRRNGSLEPLEPLDLATTDRLLADALREAQSSAAVDFHGVVLEVTGNPDIDEGAVDDEEGEGQ
jgi:CRISPR-associated protein Csb1